MHINSSLCAQRKLLKLITAAAATAAAVSDSFSSTNKPHVRLESSELHTVKVESHVSACNLDVVPI